MATVRREIDIEAAAADVWEIISDFSTGPQRMAPGLVTDCRLDTPEVRVVTFANGTVARERLIGIDHHTRRLAFSIIGDTVHPTHDNASMEVIVSAHNRTHFVFIHDVLPNELATPMGAAMDHAILTLKRAMEES